MCQASITEAFYFSRSHGELIHQHLFERLIDFIHGNAGGEIRAARGVELIGLPLDDKEERWLEEYLAEGKGTGLFGAKDTLMMRKIATGRSQEAANLARSIHEKKSIHGVSWSTLSGGLQQS